MSSASQTQIHVEQSSVPQLGANVLKECTNIIHAACVHRKLVEDGMLQQLMNDIRGLASVVTETSSLWCLDAPPTASSDFDRILFLRRPLFYNCSSTLKVFSKILAVPMAEVIEGYGLGMMPLDWNIFAWKVNTHTVAMELVRDVLNSGQIPKPVALRELKEQAKFLRYAADQADGRGKHSDPLREPIFAFWEDMRLVEDLYKTCKRYIANMRGLNLGNTAESNISKDATNNNSVHYEHLSGTHTNSSTPDPFSTNTKEVCDVQNVLEAAGCEDEGAGDSLCATSLQETTPAQTNTSTMSFQNAPGNRSERDLIFSPVDTLKVYPALSESSCSLVDQPTADIGEDQTPSRQPITVTTSTSRILDTQAHVLAVSPAYAIQTAEMFPVGTSSTAPSLCNLQATPDSPKPLYQWTRAEKTQGNNGLITLTDVDSDEQFRASQNELLGSTSVAAASVFADSTKENAPLSHTALEYLRLDIEEPGTESLSTPSMVLNDAASIRQCIKQRKYTRAENLLENMSFRDTLTLSERTSLAELFYVAALFDSVISLLRVPLTALLEDPVGASHVDHLLAKTYFALGIHDRAIGHCKLSISKKEKKMDHANPSLLESRELLIQLMQSTGSIDQPAQLRRKYFTSEQRAFLLSLDALEEVLRSNNKRVARDIMTRLLDDLSDRSGLSSQQYRHWLETFKTWDFSASILGFSKEESLLTILLDSNALDYVTLLCLRGNVTPGLPAGRTRPALDAMLRWVTKFGAINSLELLQTLLDAGADIEADGTGMTNWRRLEGSSNCVSMTPLHLATDSGFASNVQYLVDRGANVNARTRDGKTALMLAWLNGHLDIVGILRGAIGQDQTN
ncbi:hypothetical protein BDW69DRAFT_188673 [Aspergillus filifer]